MPFTNGFKGFLSVMPTCIFAMSGSENSALVAAETDNPRKAVPRAVSSIWLRLSLFYVLGSLMITITVSPKDPNLFGGSGVNASPFVIAYRNAGLAPLAHIMNAVIFISVLSTGSISAYGGSRTLMGLTHLNLAPKVGLRSLSIVSSSSITCLSLVTNSSAYKPRSSARPTNPVAPSPDWSSRLSLAAAWPTSTSTTRVRRSSPGSRT